MHGGADASGSPGYWRLLSRGGWVCTIRPRTFYFEQMSCLEKRDSKNPASPFRVCEGGIVLNHGIVVGGTQAALPCCCCWALLAWNVLLRSPARVRVRRLSSGTVPHRLHHPRSALLMAPQSFRAPPLPFMTQLQIMPPSRLSSLWSKSFMALRSLRNTGSYLIGHSSVWVRLFLYENIAIMHLRQDCYRSDIMYFSGDPFYGQTTVSLGAALSHLVTMPSVTHFVVPV